MTDRETRRLSAFVDVFNLFVPTSQGQYFFDSIDEFRNRTAAELVYQNAVTNDAVTVGILAF